MKGICVVVIVCCFVNFSISQTVGINSTGAVPATSAILDVSSVDKGLLVPRIDIIDLATAIPVTAPVTSLLVYNTNVASGVGYYFWDGTSWIQLIDGNGALGDHDWYKAGGITDADNINDNIYTEGNVGIGTLAPQRALHIVGDGGVSDDVAIEANTNIVNYSPLVSLWRSRGTNAAKTAVLANDKIGVVDGRGWTGATWKSLASFSIVAETDLATSAYGALFFNTTNNGTSTERMRIISDGKVGVGLTNPRGRLEVKHDVTEEYAAVLFNTQDIAGNVLLIESNGGSDDDTLIYAIGDVNGTPVDKFILLGDGRVGVNHNAPNVLTKLDVNGYHIGQVFSFSAYSTNTITNYSDGSLGFAEVEDINNNYNGTEYTAPVDGLYYFSTNVTFFGGDGDDDSQDFRFLKNNTVVINNMIIDPEFLSSPGVEIPISNSCLVRLIAGETLEVEIVGVDGGTPVSDYSARSFMGYFVSK